MHSVIKLPQTELTKTALPQPGIYFFLLNQRFDYTRLTKMLRNYTPFKGQFGVLGKSTSWTLSLSLTAVRSEHHAARQASGSRRVWAHLRAVVALGCFKALGLSTVTQHNGSFIGKTDLGLFSFFFFYSEIRHVSTLRLIFIYAFIFPFCLVLSFGKLRFPDLFGSFVRVSTGGLFWLC